MPGYNRRNMKNFSLFLLGLICIAVVIAAGCTGVSNTPTVTTMQTAAQTTIPPTPMIAPTVVIVTTQTTIPTTDIAATDPILHRYIRQYSDTIINGQKTGYEFRFYPGGILNYREGTTSMVSDNIKIDTVTGEASGTWKNMGNMTYLIMYLPTGVNGAQIIRQYTLVPAHEEKEYPGVIIKEHIESSYETDQINKGQQRSSNIMYYPERAKID